MEKVFVKSGIIKGDFSFVRRCSGIRFRKIIPPSREIHSGYSIDNFIRDVNETFSEAGHETHNMR